MFSARNGLQCSVVQGEYQILSIAKDTIHFACRQTRERALSECEDHVHLSWAHIIRGCPNLLEVVADKQDVHYSLYQDCIQYLRARYPPDSLTCSLSKELGELSDLPSSFGTLVNLLADRYPKPDLTTVSGRGLQVTLSRRSVLDFILTGVLAVTVTVKSHIACDLRESPGDTTESDLYQALFLDCIQALWSYECYLRANTAVWSPMPWSSVSLLELSAMSQVPGKASSA